MGGAKSLNAGGKTWKRVKNGVYDVLRTMLEVPSQTGLWDLNSQRAEAEAAASQTVA